LITQKEKKSCAVGTGETIKMDRETAIKAMNNFILSKGKKIFNLKRK
jgi:hypothetical protein